MLATASLTPTNRQRKIAVPAYLVLKAGSKTNSRFELKAEEKTLMGRDWDCQIVLKDPQSSRIHAEVFKNEDGWWIKDNKSSNGTFVNGQPADSALLIDCLLYTSDAADE